MQGFASLASDDLKEVVKVLRDILGKRSEDVKDFDNLQNIFMRGRKVGKLPTASNDVAVTDRVGDFNFSVAGDYIYFCVDASGTVAWRRIALTTW